MSLILDQLQHNIRTAICSEEEVQLKWIQFDDDFYGAFDKDFLSAPSFNEVQVPILCFYRDKGEYCMVNINQGYTSANPMFQPCVTLEEVFDEYERVTGTFSWM